MYLTEFNKSWIKSWSFRAWVITLPTVSIGSIIGGLLGMFYTVYTDAFAVLFAAGVCLTGALMIFVGTLYCRKI